MIADEKKLYALNEIGIALSKERNIRALMEKIVQSAKELTSADGGTLYTVTADGTLHFEIALSDSLGFHVGGTSGIPAPFPDLPLFLKEGVPNENLMAAYVVHQKKTLNIKDAYTEMGFDFSGTRRFDEKTGYRTKAVLTTPIKNHEDEVIAVLQLINPKDRSTFSSDAEQLVESLASQAGVALTNQLLIRNLHTLFESLIRVIAEAVDEKSPATGNHSKRMAVIAVALAQAVNTFSKDELYELEVAALLHDCGKITTPVHIIEKHSKLETIFNRMELVDTRFFALAAKLKQEEAQKKLEWFELHCPREYSKAQEEFTFYEMALNEKLLQLHSDLEFVQRCNEDKESITQEALTRLQRIAQMSFDDHRPMLNPDELENLSIVQGTLNAKERKILEHHVVMTYRMLSQLNFPKELRKVPEIAASHHERVDGRGYPRGLKREQISIQARILAIADLFEALSAPDRPYRDPLPLTQIFQIMQRHVDEGHLDPDLFALFMQEKVYLPYARKYLTPEQLDLPS